MLLLFLMSTLLHSMPIKFKHLFSILDHSAIYILIAGTYTPFLLVTIKGVLGWTLFGIVWGLAIAGILFKVFFIHRFEFVSLIFYIVMGWLILIAIKPLYIHLTLTGFALLVIRWSIVYVRFDLLRMEKDPIQPCDLACFCYGWQCLNVFLRPLIYMRTFFIDYSA